MAPDADPYVVNWSDRTAGLVEQAQNEQQWYERLAAALLRPDDRVAADIGCGGGGMTLALAAALGEPGRVLAVDGSPDVLAAVRDRLAGRSGSLAGRSGPLATVDLVKADLDAGVEPVRAVAAGPVDLVWASASVHHAGDQQGAVDTLVSLLGPGGRLALAEGGLPARHLPWDLGIGEPGLEARLDAANERWFTRMRAELPGATRMPYGWTETLRRAGLTDVTTRTTVREQPAPLGEADRRRLAERFVGWVDRLRSTGLVDPADLAVWDRLLDPEDPDWLGHRRDLFTLSARSVHIGECRG